VVCGEGKLTHLADVEALPQQGQDKDRQMVELDEWDVGLKMVTRAFSKF